MTDAVTAPARTVTTTAADLWRACCSAQNRDDMGIELIWCGDTPGTLDRKPSGFDYNAASVAVWCNGRRVYALVDTCGLGYEVSYSEQHPFGSGIDDVEVVDEWATLELREIG